MDVCMTSYEVAATHKALAAHDREDLVQSEYCMVWRDTPVRLRPRRLAITRWGLAVSQSRRDLEHIWQAPSSWIVLRGVSFLLKARTPCVIHVC